MPLSGNNLGWVITLAGIGFVAGLLFGAYAVLIAEMAW